MIMLGIFNTLFLQNIFSIDEKLTQPAEDKSLERKKQLYETYTKNMKHQIKTLT